MNFKRTLEQRQLREMQILMPEVRTSPTKKNGKRLNHRQQGYAIKLLFWNEFETRILL